MDTQLYQINYGLLPERLQGGMQRYIENKIELGGFLKAVLSNDLYGTFSYADSDMRSELYNIIRWLYNEAPGGCWGSVMNYKSWLAGDWDDKSGTASSVTKILE